MNEDDVTTAAGVAAMGGELLEGSGIEEADAVIGLTPDDPRLDELGSLRCFVPLASPLKPREGS